MAEQNNNIHFFASSVGEWRTTNQDRDLKQLLRIMDRGGLHYALYMVPLPHDAEYKIRMFRPAVEGAVWLGDFEPTKRK